MKNKFLKSLSNTLKTACVIFTCIVFAFYLLGVAFENALQVLTLSRLALLFLFSIWFAVSNKILKSKKMNLILRVVLHFISSVLGFFIIFVYLPGNTQKPSSAFTLTLFFAVAYILIAACVLIVLHFTKKKKNEKEEYEPVYDKKSNS